MCLFVKQRKYVDSYIYLLTDKKKTSRFAQTWMKGFQTKVKRVKRCFAHRDSSADVIGQCSVHSTWVVTTLPQGFLCVRWEKSQVLKD